jgi:hypothetical protein
MLLFNKNVIFKEHYRMGGSYKWPYVEQVKDYRKKVRSLILRLIDRLYLNLPVTMNDQTV